MTHDKWHMTCDIGHMTCDTWLLMWGEHSLKISKFQLTSFNGLWFIMFWRFEAVCRTAPATPGLLNNVFDAICLTRAASASGSYVVLLCDEGGGALTNLYKHIKI